MRGGEGEGREGKGPHLPVAETKNSNKSFGGDARGPLSGVSEGIGESTFTKRATDPPRTEHAWYQPSKSGGAKKPRQ